MADFSLGQAPHRMTLYLASGADFVAALRRNDGQPWPLTGTAELDIGPAVWTATTAGDTLLWEEDETDVDALIAAKPTKVRLYWNEGDVRMLWASGPVVIK